MRIARGCKCPKAMPFETRTESLLVIPTASAVCCRLVRVPVAAAPTDTLLLPAYLPLSLRNLRSVVLSCCSVTRCSVVIVPLLLTWKQNPKARRPEGVLLCCPPRCSGARAVPVRRQWDTASTATLEQEGPLRDSAKRNDTANCLLWTKRTAPRGTEEGEGTYLKREGSYLSWSLCSTFHPHTPLRHLLLSIAPKYIPSAKRRFVVCKGDLRAIS